MGALGFTLLVVRRFCEVAAICVLFFMMTLTCVDIVARYFFNSPISGAFELTEISLALLVFLSFPIACLSDSHIKVDLITNFGSGLLNHIVHALSYLIGLAIFTALTMQLWTHSMKFKRYDQVTNSLEIPLYYVGLIATACCLMCVVVMIISGVKNTLASRN